MQIVNASAPFNFSYPAFDENTGLFVRASIYDVTSGSPSLLGTVNLANTAFGVYGGSYQGATNKTYLVIILVYTTNSYAVVDTTRAPWSEVYTTQQSITQLGFDYGAFDQATGLFIQASIYDLTSGSSFVTAVAMSHVLGGVYFGAYTGTTNHSYLASIASYTSSGYSVLDTTRAPASQDFMCINNSGGGGTTVVNVLASASMSGSATSGTLVAVSNNGTLVR